MEQKKKYVVPRIEVLRIETEGVLAASGGPSGGSMSNPGFGGPSGNSQNSPGVSGFVKNVFGK